jgi:hypothetical protein
MADYVVTFPTEGNLPAPQSVSPIEIGSDVKLFQEGNQWKASITVQADNQDAAISAARIVGGEKLTLFQVFLAGSSTGFKIAIPEGAGCTVENLSTGRTGARSNVVVVTVAGISASASVMVTSNINSAIASLRTVYPTPADQNDCQVVLYYYRKGMNESEPLYKFLNHVTAIEAMLSEGTETTEKVSRRLAVLVSSRFGSMQETFEEFKEYYNTRSRILHGDKIPELSSQTVERVSELARTATRNYLLLRRTLSERDVKMKLDKFFDAVALEQIRQATAF